MERQKQSKPWDVAKAGSCSRPAADIPKYIRQQKMRHNILIWNVWSTLSLLFKLVSAMATGELVNAYTNSTTSSSTSSSCRQNSTRCAHFDISYPFWDSTGPCAKSPSFVLSNCSSASSYAHWDSFSNITLQAGVPGDPPPTAIITDMAVTGCGQSCEPSAAYTAGINLTWDTSLLALDVCDSLFTSKDFSKFHIPSSVNLTGFAGDEFQFSGADSDLNAAEYSDLNAPEDSFLNVNLFFNCTNQAALSHYVHSTDARNGIWEQDSDWCGGLKAMCKRELSTSSCISTISPNKELRLLHAMDTLACSHFTFGIAPNYGVASIFLSTGLVRLFWKSSSYEDNDSDNGLDIGSENLPDAGLRRTIQICLGVTLPVVVILVGALLGFCYFGKIREGFLSSRLAPWLSVNNLKKQLIDVLKKLLRRLQKSTYRPNLSTILSELDGLTERPIEYSYSSIASATRSFSHAVGEGGFGVVYKGTLATRGAGGEKEGAAAIEIAVKVLQIRWKHMKKHFLNEVATIGRVHHVNVVRLLGFCVEEDEEMLVYEYVANGSLDRWLFAGKSDGSVEKPVLDWSQRYAIALGVARGLSYLHEECRHRTVHCDIKPQNILLDERMSPKIADFGLSRLMGREESQVVTFAKGTPGYMAPEFWTGGESRLSTKFDVYSYGMVLLELISGGRNFVRVGDSVCCFPAVAFKAAMQGNMGAILDPRLGMLNMEQAASHDSYDGRKAEELDGETQAVWNAAFVALWCIQDHPASRPAMSEVVQYLEGTMAISKNPPPPSIAIVRPLVTPFDMASHDSEGLTLPIGSMGGQSQPP